MPYAGHDIATKLKFDLSVFAAAISRTNPYVRTCLVGSSLG
jgi:hypothetical protein